MAGLSSKIWRMARAELNSLLDKVAEAEIPGIDPAGRLDRLKRRRSRLEREIRDVEEQMEEAADEADRSGRSSSSRGLIGRILGQDQVLNTWYRRLELPYGASPETIRRSYHALMRRYHPDLQGADPERIRIANEITVKLNQAHDGLIQAWEEDRLP